MMSRDLSRDVPVTHAQRGSFAMSKMDFIPCIAGGID